MLLHFHFSFYLFELSGLIAAREDVLSFGEPTCRSIKASIMDENIHQMLEVKQESCCDDILFLPDLHFMIGYCLDFNFVVMSVKFKGFS